MTLSIVFLDRDTLPPETIVRPPAFDHHWTEYDRTTPDQVAERVAGADIVITNKAPLRRETIEKTARLKMIAVAATGTDIVDIACCRARGIVVSNIRGYAIHTVPEHVFALILALRRSLFAYRDAVRRGRWREAAQFCFFDFPIHDLHGSRLGIVGEGAIGQAVAEIAKAFGMIPMFAAHKGRTGLGPLYTPWDEVLETSDVITLHCPLTPATRDMIALPEFKAMRRRPLIVNTARGGLIDEAALVTALKDGLIAGAAIDVLPTEPPADDHPFLALMDRPDFILTPHVAWASREAIQTLADQLMDNIEAFVAGNPANPV
jgi:glycerate dehydrogenase